MGSFAFAALRVGLKNLYSMAVKSKRVLPLNDGLSEGGQGVEVGGPGLDELKQVSVICRHQQKAVQHHLISIHPQLRVCSGQNWGQHSQLAEVGKQINPALPGSSILLHKQDQALQWTLVQQMLLQAYQKMRC